MVIYVGVVAPPRDTQEMKTWWPCSHEIPPLLYNIRGSARQERKSEL